MKFRFLMISVLMITGLAFAGEGHGKLDKDSAKALKKVIAGDHRSEDNKARDQYRNPYETLSFLGITKDMTVVEITPGGGWYTEILAPYLKDSGVYYAAGYDPEGPRPWMKGAVERFQKKLDSNAAYGKTKVTVYTGEIAPEGTADAVLTFRNLHNWMSAGNTDELFQAFNKALKKGGILGIVEHRAKNDKEQDPKAKSGYVRQDYVIALAEKAGFELVGSSEVNANKKDTTVWPQGVWTLPPVLATKDDDGDKYKQYGESDRMTLKFRKK